MVPLNAASKGESKGTAQHVIAKMWNSKNALIAIWTHLCRFEK